MGLPSREVYIPRLIYILYWVYTTDPDSIEIKEEYRIERGKTWRADTIDEWREVFGQDLKKRGRRSVVANITSYLSALTPSEEDLLIFLAVELSEVELCLEQNHTVPALLRVASFLQQCFNERTGADERLYEATKAAYEDGEISKQQAKLAQFVRLCRNDAAHNFSYDTEYSFEVHDHAAICALTLLNSLKDTWFHFNWHVDNRLSGENCIRVIEEEFGFEWDADPDAMTYEKYSLRDEYDNRD